MSHNLNIFEVIPHRKRFEHLLVFTVYREGKGKHTLKRERQRDSYFQRAIKPF
jgi:hypothetical protein